MRRFWPRLVFFVLALYIYVDYQLIWHLNLPVVFRSTASAFFALPMAAILWLPLFRWSDEELPSSRWFVALEYFAFGSMSFMSFVLALAVARDLVFVLSLVFGGLPGWIYGEGASAFIFVLSLLCLIMGVVFARKTPSVIKVEVPIEGLPEELDGFSIAQISDLHVGSTIGRSFVERVVKAVGELEVDVIALTGDIGDGDPAALQNEIEPLGRLRAPHGVFYVPGNHEYYWGVEAWLEQMRKFGMVVLLNEHRVIARGPHKILIAGVADPAAEIYDQGRLPDPLLALKGGPTVTAARILLCHQPHLATEAVHAGFSLQLSGHTHGGQFFPWVWIIRFVHRYYRGLNRCGKMWIYVSQGTGYWGPPVRLGARSEISWIVLRPT